MWGLNTTIYTIHKSFTKFKNYILYIDVFVTLLYTIVLCQRENENILMLDIDDQNTTWVIAPKGHGITFLYD